MELYSIMVKSNKLPNEIIIIPNKDKEFHEIPKKMTLDIWHNHQELLLVVLVMSENRWYY